MSLNYTLTSVRSPAQNVKTHFMVIMQLIKVFMQGTGEQANVYVPATNNIKIGV